MGHKLVTALASITLLSSCSARVISQNVMSSVLQDIMSPANSDKAMQLINIAAKRANKNMAIPDIRSIFASNDCGPARAIISRNELPGRIIANEMILPRAYITNDGIARAISNEERVFSPEMYPAQQVVRQIVREIVPANFDSPREIYQAASVALPQESFVYPRRTSFPAPNPYLPAASAVPNPYLPVADPYLPAPPPNPYTPFGAPNPYLPVASPISAMSPSLMPPPTQSKGQFLRKIPIPPPTL